MLSQQPNKEKGTHYHHQPKKNHVFLINQTPQDKESNFLLQNLVLTLVARPLHTKK